MEPTWSPEDYQDEAAYSSDDSSDGSIPNIQPLNLFTAFNSSARASRPAPTESSGDDSGAEEVDVIRSDLPQSASQQVNGGDVNHPDPVSAETPLPGSAIPPLSGQRYSVVGGKRIMTAAAKEHHSQIMKKKWATGVMSQVGEKAREAAKKRKSAFEGATDEETRLGKRASIAADRPSSNSPVLSASSHTASLSRSGQSLWEYIRPYLNVFQYSQPPTKSWVRELLSLPRVRDLKFNPRRQSKRPFVDTDVKKVAALVLQLTGKPARLPCTRCLNGNGVFDGCIMLASNASVGTNIKNCANCWYSHQACTYETSVADDRTLEREAFSQVADGEMTDKPEVIQHVTYDSKHPYVEKTPAPAIHRSLSGRRYCDWPDEFGSTTTLKSGILLPDGYELHGGSGKPWLCPVDKCGRPFPNVRALGSHFPRKHYAQLLNDNLDGTFSVIGLYDSPKLGNGGSYLKEPPSYPYVASQSAKGASSRPPLRPESARRPEVPERHPVQDDSDNGEEVDEQPEALIDADERSRSGLSRSAQPKAISYGREASEPRRSARRLSPDEEHHDEAYKFLTDRIAQMTQLRDRQRRRRDEENQDFTPLEEDDLADAVVGVPGRQAEDVAVSKLDSGLRETRQGATTHAASLAYMAGKIPAVEDEDGHATPVPNMRTSGPAGSRNVREIKKSAPPPEGDVVRQANLGDLLEMEDWEIAPGRIRSETAPTQENIALSRPYLTSNKSIQVHNDLAFRVDVVNAGSTVRFEPAADKVRCCSVARGKVRIKIDGEPEFSIGPDGQFTIRAGVACSAQNRLYIDAALHVSTMTVYD